MKKVLLVEDEYIIAMVIRKRVAQMGYEVLDQVTTAEDAIRSAREHQPDVVLMDIKIDGPVDGIEAMHEIRKFSDVPVVYVTGNTDSHTKERACKSQMIGYIEKPVDFNQLRKLIEEAVSQKA